MKRASHHHRSGGGVSRLAQAAMLTKLRFRPTNAPLGVFSFRINYYTGLQEDLMDGIKQNEEQNDARKPVSEHITDLVAAAAGALV